MDGRLPCWLMGLASAALLLSLRGMERSPDAFSYNIEMSRWLITGGMNLRNWLWDLGGGLHLGLLLCQSGAYAFGYLLFD